MFQSIECLDYIIHNILFTSRAHAMDSRFVTFRRCAVISYTLKIARKSKYLSNNQYKQTSNSKEFLKEAKWKYLFFVEHYVY